MKHKGLVLVILSVLALQGCIYVRDTGERRNGKVPTNVEPTVGQELLDLDRARAQGLITDAEYERAKQDILDDIN